VVTIPTNRIARLFCDDCDECFRVEISVFGDTEVIPNCPECNKPLSGPGVFNPECACNNEPEPFVIFDDPVGRPGSMDGEAMKTISDWANSISFKPTPMVWSEDDLYQRFLAIRDQGE